MASGTLSASCTMVAHSVPLSSSLKDLWVGTLGIIDMLSFLRMELLLQLQLTRPSCDAAVSAALLGLRGTDSELKRHFLSAETGISFIWALLFIKRFVR